MDLRNHHVSSLLSFLYGFGLESILEIFSFHFFSSIFFPSFSFCFQDVFAAASFGCTGIYVAMWTFLHLFFWLCSFCWSILKPSHAFGMWRALLRPFYLHHCTLKFQHFHFFEISFLFIVIETILRVPFWAKLSQNWSPVLDKPMKTAKWIVITLRWDIQSPQVHLQGPEVRLRLVGGCSVHSEAALGKCCQTYCPPITGSSERWLTNCKSSSWIKTLPPPPTSPLLARLVWVLGFLFSHLRLLGIVVSWGLLF